jgi:hypothetical protein
MQLVCPAPEQGAVRGRHTKQLGDHDHRQWIRERVNEFELGLAEGLIQQLLGKCANPWFKLGNRARRKYLAHEAPQLIVPRWTHVDNVALERACARTVRRKRVMIGRDRGSIVIAEDVPEARVRIAPHWRLSRILRYHARYCSPGRARASSENARTVDRLRAGGNRCLDWSQMAGRLNR